MGPGTMAAAVTENPSITIPNVPRLEPSGSNWAIFSLRFQEAMEANRKWGHFDGSSTRPAAADPNKPTDEEKATQVDWDQNEMVAKYLLTQHMPDSAAVRLRPIALVADRWAKVKTEYSVKSQYAEVDLLTAFSEMRCSSVSEVWTFLGQMRVKREELAAVGVEVTGKEYQSAILKSIPEEMSKFASGLLTSTRMFAPGMKVDPDILIDNISEEADRLTARRKRDKSAKGRGQQGGAQDKALAATGEGGRRKRKGKCHNCGKLGHWARECRSQKKDDQQSGQSNANANASTSQNQSQQGSQPPAYTGSQSRPANKPVGSANAVADADDEPDGCWAADFASEEDSERASSWSGSDSETWEAALAEWEDLELQYPEPDKEPHAPTESAGGAQAVITAVEEAKSACVELYDSGATRHLSPYHEDFTTY